MKYACDICDRSMWSSEMHECPHCGAFVCNYCYNEDKECCDDCVDNEEADKVDEAPIQTKPVYKCAMQFCAREVEKPGMYCIYHQPKKQTEKNKQPIMAQEENMIQQLEKRLKTNVTTTPVVVFHKTLGRGIIRERLIGNKIFVRFKDGQRMFVFPDCFQQGYLIADGWGDLTKPTPVKTAGTSTSSTAAKPSPAPVKTKVTPTQQPITNTVTYRPLPNISSGLKRAVEKVEQEKGKIFRADTHVEFLNRVFGTNYNAWMKCVWNFAPDIEVWMVKFYNNKNEKEWRNRFLNQDKIREEYLGNRLEDPRKYERPEYKIVVSIEEEDKDGGRRRYKVEGVFRFCRDESISLRDCHRDPYFIHRRVVKHQGNYYTIYNK